MKIDELPEQASPQGTDFLVGYRPGAAPGFRAKLSSILAWIQTQAGVAWANISGKPDSFTPSAHTHDAGVIVSGTVATARLGSGTANASTYLRGDNTWAAVSGSGTGDVVGPAAATDNAAARFDSTTGKLLQDGVVLIGDTGNITGVGTINALTLPGSNFVGLTDAQTLTNKTLTTPTIGSFANAAHTHQNSAGGGQLDHGAALTGLSDDDHSQYGLLAGRAGGQSLTGGTGSGDKLTLASTSHATKGGIELGTDDFVLFDEHASAPGTPAAGKVAVYAKSDGKLYRKDDAGTEAELGGGGGGGSGDVVGPASATDNAIVRFDSTTGKLVQNSAVTIDDSGNVANLGTLNGRTIPSSAFVGTTDSQTLENKLHEAPIILDYMVWVEGAAPGTPVANNVGMYAKSDGILYSKDDAGVETPMGGTAYPLLAGRSGGQSLTGGTGSGDKLTLASTSHSTKGGIELGTDDFVIFDEHASAPGTPASGKVAVYAKSDGKIYRKDDAGTEAELGGGGGGTEYYTITLAQTAVHTPVDSATSLVGKNFTGNTGVWDNAKVVIPVTGTIIGYRLGIRITGTLGSTETVNVYLRHEDTTDFGNQTCTMDAANVYVSATGLSQAVTAGDGICLKLVFPAFATNPTNVVYHVTVVVQV